MFIEARSRRAIRFALALALFALGCASARAQALYDTFVQAVVADRSDEVKRLLARGMDPNTVDPAGDPVLLVAARAGWVPTVDALLAAGAKVDAQNKFGDRPLMVAALGGHLAIVKKLCAKGAQLDPPGWTPLIYAASNGQNETVAYLLGIGANIEAESPNGTTALMMAVRGGHAATVDLLIAKGADVNHRNESGASALAWAERGGYEAVVKALKQRGAKP